MSYYRICPRCGANLDPGEVCDCLDIEAKLLINHLTEKRAAPSAVNAEDGKVEKVLKGSVSASIVR